jgi:uncharacterized protein YecE (DUF72 family)
VKAWQQFTHAKEDLQPSDIRIFQEGVQPLIEAGKLGCLLFQFPTSFHCTDGTRDRLRQLLEAFADYDKAVELRHRSWDDQLDIIEETHSALTFIDEPKFRDSTRQNFGAQNRMLYLRFHGRRAEKWWRHEHRNERYDYLYSKEEIQPYVVRLKTVTEEKAIQKAYVFFNNHPGAKAVANAVMLREELDIPVKEELPETLITAFPELKGDL